ncbi:MAG: hypothetical protein ACK8QZ_01900, partial [Anaerolineales bacterium]
MPSFTENLSFQTPAFAGLRVFDGQVILTDARQVIADLTQHLRHAGAVVDGADGNLIKDPAVQLFAPLRARQRLWRLLHGPCPLDVQRIGPAMGLVHHVAQAV